MLSLKGKDIYLRALELEDIDFLATIENDEKYWHLSHTQTPFSKFVLKKYLENAHQDIYEAKQLRLVISTYQNEAAGLIDLFDFDFKNARAGVGIIILEEFRRNGYAFQALQLLCTYAFAHLQLHQVYASVNANNLESLALFNQLDFKEVGIKKDWNFYMGSFQDEYLLQKINNVY